MSHHAKWIVCLIGRRKYARNNLEVEACDRALLRHVRAMFRGY